MVFRGKNLSLKLLQEQYDSQENAIGQSSEIKNLQKSSGVTEQGVSGG